ncbi:MAG: MASE3 domain-containing protein [Anaerolineales bacterium]|jgi:signal transduction histidine kinase
MHSMIQGKLANRLPAVSTKYLIYFILRAALVFSALIFISRFNYLLFHSLAELFSVVVAFSIYILAWNSRRYMNNGYFLLLGVAFLFIGLLDVLHTLAYEGMGVFPRSGSNLATQLWISARFMQSLSFLIAFMFLTRRVRAIYLLGVYAIITTLIIFSIFVWKNFPISYIDGVGLTAFKRTSEYVISLILMVSMLGLVRYRENFDPGVLLWLLLSVGSAILSELAFTEYVGVYDFANMVGHLLKIASFYFIYKAIVVTGLIQPYDLMFRNLKQSEEALLKAHDELEERVRLRTAEIVQVNQALQHEVEEHKRTERELLKYREHLEELVVERTKELEHQVSIREMAEAASRKYAHQLERSNRELQDFASIASHDLQEPLRKIQAFGDRLEKKIGDDLDEHEFYYLDRMLDAATRMSNMIDELLAYSRVTTKFQPHTCVDLNETLQGVISDLEIRLEQTEGQIESEPLPTVNADRLQMRQLMQNLIGNALKFHRPGVPPLVKVTGEQFTEPASGEEMVRLKVQDNGIGFDERYLDQIFRPFRRLVGHSEFDGSGMGLAICRKIVERHGGSITAESKEGQGTTFIITLPVGEIGQEDEQQDSK